MREALHSLQYLEAARNREVPPRMISRRNYLVVNDRHKLGKSCVQI
jgi:hypothetical protein